MRSVDFFYYFCLFSLQISLLTKKKLCNLLRMLADIEKMKNTLEKTCNSSSDLVSQTQEMSKKRKRQQELDILNKKIKAKLAENQSYDENVLDQQIRDELHSTIAYMNELKKVSLNLIDESIALGFFFFFD